MSSVIDIQSQHHEYESLLNMTQYSSDVEFKTISAFLKELSDQSCTFVSVFHNSVHEVIYIQFTFTLLLNAIQLTSILPTGSISCTYPELIKMKAKLELYFAVERTRSIFLNTGFRFRFSEAWVNNLFCEVTEEVRSVIQTAFPSAACPGP